MLEMPPRMSSPTSTQFMPISSSIVASNWTECRDYYCKSHGSSHQMRGRNIGLEDTICLVCGHKGHGYLSCSWIGLVLQKEKEFQVNQRNSWNQTVPLTKSLPVVERMEEREIRNARIAPNTPRNTTTSASPAPQAGPRNYTAAAGTTRHQKQPTKWHVTNSTPINTNFLYNRRQCAFCKKFGHNVQTCIKKCKTLNDFNNGIQSRLNSIIDSR